MDEREFAQVALARQLADRLERLSVDSIWARRASGLRGNLLRWLEAYDAGSQPSLVVLEALIERGHEILTSAAREIRAPEK